MNQGCLVAGNMSKKDKRKCQTCANQVNGSYCTMGKSIQVQSRQYKKCECYKKYVPPPPKPEPKPRQEKIDYKALGDFGKFLQKGGHYSFRTGKFIG